MDTCGRADVLFFGIFWAIGIGMFYVAARNKWAQTRVVVTGNEVILARRLFGRVKEKRVPRPEITDVKTEEFYQSNDTPVHGIVLHAGKHKLKFGSALSDDEKGWLAADIRRELLGGAECNPRPIQQPENAGIQSTRSFSLPIPNANKHLWPSAIVLTLMGIAFFAGGFFLIDPAPIGGACDAPLGVRIFDAIFDFITSGFRFFWLLISLAMVTGGVWLWVRLTRDRGTERRLEGDALMISIRKIQHGRILSEETFPRSDVSGVFTSSSGHSNGKPMNRIDLQLRNQSKTLAHWVDADAAERFVSEVEGFLRDA